MGKTQGFWILAHKKLVNMAIKGSGFFPSK